MAHLWQQDPHHQWHPVPLEGPALNLATLAPPRPFAPDGSDAGENEAAAEDALGGSSVVLCQCGEGRTQWGVMVPPGAAVRINGENVSLGMRVLQDRDELSVTPPDGEPLHAFFSAEQLAAVVPFPGENVACPRCKHAIKTEMPAVRCPGCGAWHHQIPEGDPNHPARECWTYSEHCALCSQPTALDTGYRWTPESL